MKKHSLIEHWNDVSTWNSDAADYAGLNAQMVFFIAYERWLNDRELLTVEDEYEWVQTPIPEGAARAGSIP